MSVCGHNPNLFTQQEYDRYREASREVARSKSIPILEFRDVLRDLTIEQAYIGEHQIHLSEIAHQRIAKAVVGVLDDK